MSEIKFIGGALRMQAYKKLKVFLANPGKFCLIVLGSRGSGKHFAIEKAFGEITSTAKKDLCLEELKFIEPNELPVEVDALNKLFKVNEYKTIVIEDVEELNDEQQRILFKALSTTDGTFGIGQNINLRIVFTSSKDVDTLREDKARLQGLLWDRISQLVVEFPNFKIEGDNVLNDFYATWSKMKFHETKGYEHFGTVPKHASLEKFLEDYSEKFEGGFRDLDKLACMYFNYRILFYANSKRTNDEIEKKIINEIKNDFIGKSQLHSSSANDLSVFQIQPGFKMEDLYAQFRIQVRKWAWKEYGTLQKAADKLGISQSSIKLFVEGKATKKRRSESTKRK